MDIPGTLTAGAICVALDPPVSLLPDVAAVLSKIGVLHTEGAFRQSHQAALQIQGALRCGEAGGKLVNHQRIKPIADRLDEHAGNNNGEDNMVMILMTGLVGSVVVVFVFVLAVATKAVVAACCCRIVILVDVIVVTLLAAAMIIGRPSARGTKAEV